MWSSCWPSLTSETHKAGAAPARRTNRPAPKKWNDVWLSPAFRSFDIREDCRRIQAPLLAIQGREDPYGSLQQIEDIRPLHGRIESCVLDHCGHAPQRDQSKACLARITSFLAACP